MENLVMQGPVERERFLGLELVPGALAGAKGRVMATGERIAVVATAAVLPRRREKAHFQPIRAVPR